MAPGQRRSFREGVASGAPEATASRKERLPPRRHPAMAQPAIRTRNVRSHRRRPPRRLALAPWIAAVVVVGLLAGGGIFGYQRLNKESCKGNVTAQIIASAETSTILDNLSRSWADTSPAVNGTCVSVNVRTRDNAVMAQELG